MFSFFDNVMLGPPSQTSMNRRRVLCEYSHVRMEAKRRALDEIAARQRAADEKRNKHAETAAAGS